jgi:hypothetical protein
LRLLSFLSFVSLSIVSDRKPSTGRVVIYENNRKGTLAIRMRPVVHFVLERTVVLHKRR